jgi:hypothetical protein
VHLRSEQFRSGVDHEDPVLADEHHVAQPGADDHRRRRRAAVHGTGEQGGQEHRQAAEDGPVRHRAGPAGPGRDPLGRHLAEVYQDAAHHPILRPAG